MPREENMLILKMLQEGTITVDQAAELLAALDASEARAAPPPPTPPVPPVHSVPPTPPVPPVPPGQPILPVPPAPGDLGMEDVDSETFTRARAKIAAARERVAGVQERLAAAQDRLGKAEGSQNPWEAIADALKDVPGARSVSEALRGVDPGRIAATARRQARRVARSVRSSLGDLNLDLNINLSGEGRGEPILSVPHEATTLVPAGGTLRIRNTLGDIEAVGADVPEARVAGMLRVWAENETVAQATAESVRLAVENGPEGPTVSVQHPTRVRGLALDLKVFVPRGVKLSLLSPSGDVSAHDLHGGVVLATQSGDLHAQEIAGDVAAEAASGDVHIEGVVGNLLITTASGDISAARISGQTLRATTQSGDVSLRDVTTPTIDIETVSGDAAVRSVSGRVFRVRTVSGDVQAIETTVSEETHLDTVSGCLEVGPRGPLSGGVLTLASVSGDMDLRLPAETHGTVEITTKSGDARGRWRSAEGERKVESSGMIAFSESIGDGGAGRIVVSTVSGDIAISQENG